jgi:cadmium resistance protein CadD (predicted permease)
VHSLIAIVIVASLAFVGTMFDNYFAFAAQLLVTDRERYRRVSWAQALAIATLLLLALAVSSLLTSIPTRWIGLFAVVPWALAAHAWRHRTKPAREQFRRGAVTTFTLTLALGGDNLAVWIPLLRANGTVHALLIIIIFAIWEILFVLSAQALVKQPRVVQWGAKHAPALVPWIYVALGVLILVECGTFR